MGVTLPCRVAPDVEALDDPASKGCWYFCAQSYAYNLRTFSFALCCFVLNRHDSYTGVTCYNTQSYGYDLRTFGLGLGLRCSLFNRGSSCVSVKLYTQSYGYDLRNILYYITNTYTEWWMDVPNPTGTICVLLYYQANEYVCYIQYHTIVPVRFGISIHDCICVCYVVQYITQIVPVRFGTSIHDSVYVFAI